MVAAVVLFMVTSPYVRLQQKIAAYQYSNNQAYEAAGNGTIVSQGGITMAGTGVAFNQAIVEDLNRGSRNYSKIPGSWKDF
jgi:hypothetical protein